MKVRANMTSKLPTTCITIEKAKRKRQGKKRPTEKRSGNDPKQVHMYAD